MRELIERLESISEGTVLDRLEKLTRKTIKGGRNVLFGFPVDIDDRQDPAEGLTMQAVDRDAAVGLAKELRRKGIKAKLIRRSNEIFIEGLVEGELEEADRARPPAILFELRKKLKIKGKGWKCYKQKDKMERTKVGNYDLEIEAKCFGESLELEWEEDDGRPGSMTTSIDFDAYVVVSAYPDGDLGVEIGLETDGYKDFDVDDVEVLDDWIYDAGKYNTRKILKDIEKKMNSMQAELEEKYLDELKDEAGLSAV